MQNYDKVFGNAKRELSKAKRSILIDKIAKIVLGFCSDFVLLTEKKYCKIVRKVLAGVL